MKMTKYFIYYFFIPFAISLFAGTGYSIYINQGYESEWLTAESAVGFDVYIIFFIALIMLGLCLSIFFNKIKSIRASVVLRLIFWIIPLGFPLIIIYYHFERYFLTKGNLIKYDDVKLFTERFNMDLIIFLPYVFGAIFSYVIFRKDLTNNNYPI